ncbi:histidine phosphatase family protein [Geothrix sp. PMB-07]|uniref:SixA phosphatase family protein n=1 Tax=Geothrix sp. PMB-07 TaxID=3068640 RepID=UPI002740EA3E|nr:histidine phosphatase family protein [Geothrix sp. PMB-07]WLT30248.1 histidine phosphatase family protein [Geothrix sp. PMB-07]
MTTLLLIRHGIAEDPRPGQRDMDRALTEEGWLRTRAAMKGLVALGQVPTRGFNSPYRRAAETMTCLQEAAGAFPMETSLELVPGGHPPQADLWLRGLVAEAGAADVLALISHQPFLSDLIFHLTGRDMDVKKASCTVIQWAGNAWRFERQYQPSELRA